VISKWRVRLLRFYVPLAKVLRHGEAWSGLFWAVLVGAVGGLGAIAFRKGIEIVLWVWTHHTGSLEEVAAQLLWWQRLIIPAAGGFTAGLMLYIGAKMRRGQRSTDYMEAVAVERGVIPVRGSLAKTLSSILTIGSGGSIGREGAMVQLSATVASLFGRVLKLSTPRLRLLVACGAVGGLAAVYNVTIAAALFVA
jgi:chloride channel protein, CIC family